VLGRARRHFEPAKQYLGRRLGQWGIPPWLITLSGLGLALLAGWAYTRLGPLAAALIGTAASLTDFVDGAVARYQNRQSAWGNYLEAIVDRLVELILLLTLSRDLGPVVAWAIAACMFISYCKPRVALVIPADNHDWPGLADHADRMVVLLISMALCQISLPLGRLGIGLLALLAALGSLQRLHYAYRLIAAAEASPHSTSAQIPPPRQ
jgi:phosphatidylglycerophosphate synthase